MDKKENSDFLQGDDTWILAHITQFPNMPAMERTRLIENLSLKGKRIAQFILHDLEEKNASPAELITVQGFRKWANQTSSNKHS